MYQVLLLQVLPKSAPYCLVSWCSWASCASSSSWGEDSLGQITGWCLCTCCRFWLFVQDHSPNAPACHGFGAALARRFAGAAAEIGACRGTVGSRSIARSIDAGARLAYCLAAHDRDGWHLDDAVGLPLHAAASMTAATKQHFWNNAHSTATTLAMLPTKGRPTSTKF